MPTMRYRRGPIRSGLAAVIPLTIWIASMGSIGCHAGRPGARAAPSQPPATERFRFVDVAGEAGLTRVIHAGRPGKDHILDSAGYGVAWIDYDRDGWLDIYLVNGWRLDGSTVLEKGSNALYRNRGDGTFEDVTRAAGVEGEGRWGAGVSVADYDDDGWPDLLVTCFGPNLLYRNRGDGTFADVAAEAGVETPGWNTGAAFFDADGDGVLDLYIARYVDVSLDHVLQARPTLDWKGMAKVAFGPFGLPGGSDRFFRGDGRGGFRERTAGSGLEDRAGAFGFGVRAADVDADGDVDLYVANDSNANYLYRNEGDGTFSEVGLWSGAAFDARGAAQAGMGVAAGDLDADGALDLVVTNFSEDHTTLYRGDGKGYFEDASERLGLGPATFTPLSWGVVLGDLDNDGDDDVVIANGHIYPQVDQHPELGLTYRQRNQLLENLGDGHVVEATGSAGPGFTLVRSSRGLAAGDYDNDGDLDLLVGDLDSPPALLRNESSSGSWITVEPIAGDSRGPFIGAAVTVTAGGRTFTRDSASVDSYMSVNDPRPHFGLGSASRVDEVIVRWPDGTETRRTDLAVNRFVQIRRGED